MDFPPFANSPRSLANNFRIDIYAAQGQWDRAEAALLKTLEFEGAISEELVYAWGWDIYR